MAFVVLLLTDQLPVSPGVSYFEIFNFFLEPISELPNFQNAYNTLWIWFQKNPRTWFLFQETRLKSQISVKYVSSTLIQYKYSVTE